MPNALALLDEIISSHLSACRVTRGCRSMRYVGHAHLVRMILRLTRVVCHDRKSTCSARLQSTSDALRQSALATYDLPAQPITSQLAG